MNKSQTKMMGFVSEGRDSPELRDPALRINDFKEIYNRFKDSKARQQSNRCEQCGVPFCQVACPLHNAIPLWLKFTSEGRMKDAFHALSLTTDFPEFCGRICPQDRLCEGDCVIEVSSHGGVTIGAVESYIAEYAWKEGWIKPIALKTGKRKGKVAIVGSGPAGLAAAAMLIRHNVTPVIYEKSDRAGGLLTYGIPSFKLEKQLVQRRIDWLKDSGVEFVLNHKIDSKNFDDLRKDFSAVLLAVGTHKPRSFLSGNVALPSLDFLTYVNRLNFNEKPKKEFDMKGKTVLVLGGGDTAQDCLRSAIRMGAKKVTCAYRRDRNNMPGSRSELINAEVEGVDYMWLVSPKESFAKKESGYIEVILQKMRLVEDETSNIGRKKPYPIPDSQFNYQADVVIEALGFLPENLQQQISPKLELSPYGLLSVDSLKNPACNLKKVYAAGDIIRGPSLAVEALADGRNAALAILNDMGIIKRNLI